MSPLSWIVGSILLAHVVGQPHRCPPTYTLFEEKCIYISAAQGTWAEGMRACKADGGNLVSIPDSSVQNFLRTSVNQGNYVNNITLHTNDDYVYHYMHDQGIDISHKYSIVFYSKACHDAHIALSSVKNLDSQETYEIVIGGWSDSQSVIRDCKQCAHMDQVGHSSHPLSCDDFRPFWVSWANNHIRVGTGLDVGQQQFMAWNDTDPHDVNFVAFATGFGSSGDWVIPISTYMPGKFWIGGSDLVNENEWLWLPSQMSLDEYTSWAPNEPDNANGNQHCLLMDMYTNMLWHDDDCEEKRNYICEKPLVEPGIIG